MPLLFEEIRKISDWADLHRKITKWSLVPLAVFIPAMIGMDLLMERRIKTKLKNDVSSRQQDWFDVDRYVRSGDFEQAIQIGEELILKTPQYAEAHQRLAGAYLASGNHEKAKAHYAEAFRLLPSEQNEKLLDARGSAQTGRKSLQVAIVGKPGRFFPESCVYSVSACAAVLPRHHAKYAEYSPRCG